MGRRVANLSSNTPAIPVFVRNEFLYNQTKGYGEITPGWMVGLRTIKGFAVTFYVLLENGVLFTGLPIHALCHKKNASAEQLTALEMWDSLSYDHSIFQIDFLKKMSASVLLKNKKIIKGEYKFSIDFSSQNSLGNLSETPDEWKVFHFIKLEDGNFALYSQNRILFKDAALTKETNSKSIDYLVNTQEWSSENGNKWNCANDEKYMYGAENE